MSNSRRWRQFISWYRTIDPDSFDNPKELMQEIDKKITEIKAGILKEVK